MSNISNKKVKIFIMILCTMGIVIGLTLVGIASSSSIIRYSSTFPIIIDPCVGASVQSVVAQVNIFDPLVSIDVDGNVIPHVAEKWDVSSDGLTYTFYIRPGIKFHDGSELTAEDVKFSMERMTTIGEGQAYIWMGKIKEIEIPDQYTVVFHLDNTFGPFLTSLINFYIMNKDLIMENIKEEETMYGDIGDYGKIYAADHDTGSGAYRIKEFQTTDYLLMEKNPDYFLEIDYDAPDEFKMIAQTQENTVKTLMSRREIEMTNIFMTVESLKFLSEIEGIEICSFPSSDMEYFAMNTKKPPLDDIHVRRALAWAFDYEEGVKLYPESTQAIGPVSQTVPGSHSGAFQFHRNLEKAKEELKKSKYYDNFDEYPIDMVWFSSVTREKYSMLLMANAAEIGLDIDLSETTWSLLIENVQKPETTPSLFLIRVSPGFPEAISTLEAKYHSRNTGTWAQSEWLEDHTVDKMIDETIATVDRDQRYEKTREIIEYIIDLCPSIYVVETPNRSAYQAAYVDWPTANLGKGPAGFQYEYRMRFIKIYPEKRDELLK